MCKLVSGAASAIFLLYMATAAYCGPPDRPNRGKELYSPPWSKEFVDLATSCKGLSKLECAALRRLASLPHAYWIGLNTSVSRDLQELHAVLRDALSEKRVPTIVLYSLPERDCGGGVKLHKKITPEDYQMWIPRIADAITYYKEMAIHVIIEPGALSRMIEREDDWCHKRTKRELLEERIELIRYALWNIITYDSEGRRVNPYLRVFVDAGGPGTLYKPGAKLALARALEKILRVAPMDGISVNVGGYSSFEESRAWAKELLQILQSKAKGNMTIAIDIARSGAKVAHGCNATGAALDERLPTLDHTDPVVEFTTIVKDPSTSDGDGEDCHNAGPAGAFDLLVFREYLRNTAQKMEGLEP